MKIKYINCECECECSVCPNQIGPITEDWDGSDAICKNCQNNEECDKLNLFT